MELSLHPKIVEYIKKQVNNGSFATNEAVVEAAIMRMRDGSQIGPDDETSTALKEAREQMDRGEGIPLEDVRAYWNNRLHGE